MTALLRRASLRFYLRHPWQLGLAIAGISLGVGVYVGVRLANDSAARAFDVSAALVNERTTHTLLPIEGGLDEGAYRDLVLEHGVVAAMPAIQGSVEIGGRRLPLLGIDALQTMSLRRFSQFAPAAAAPSLTRLLTEPSTVLLPASLAAELGAKAGSTLTIRVAGGEATVQVLGEVPATGGRADVEPPIVTDIATAQELLGQGGKISRIDLNLTDAAAQQLSAELPPDVVLLPTDTGQSSFAQLASAFRTNLTALGLLALVVGSFLIYGTMSFAIIQRRTTLGILRAVGVSREELVGSIVVEALSLAAVATTVGLIVGHLLAKGLVELVLQTIGDLSFGRDVSAGRPSAWIYAQGALLGIGATLLAAAKPAFDAASGAPAAVLRRVVLERGARRAGRHAALLAIPLLALSVAVLALGPSQLGVAFAGLFGVLAAGALLTPGATRLLVRGIERAFAAWLTLPVKLALRGVNASMSRAGVATAALAVAIATVNGVGIMISSFRTSLADWLDTTLAADIYLATESADTELTNLVDSGAFDNIEGVIGISRTRTRVVPTAVGSLALRAVEPSTRGYGYAIVQGDPTVALRELAAGRGVLASERLLFARDLAVGDEIVLPTSSGPKSVPIVGAFRDFNTGELSVVMALTRYRRDWQDLGLTGVGIDLAAGANGERAEAAVRALLESEPRIRIRSSARVEELSLEVFDRTFKITEVLRLLAAVVAFLGILSALLAIELERARELAVLRALGLDPKGLTITLLTQTGVLGLAAGLMAMPIGTGLALLLVHVINRRSFGWSMDFVVAPEALLSGLLLAVGAALLAGLYPAWRASHVALGPALREE